MKKTLYQLNKSQLTDTEIKKHRNATISKSINGAYTIDAQLAVIFNALELIIADMEDCEHKRELEALLAFRAQCKNQANDLEG